VRISSCTDKEALEAFQLCTRLEGIIPALEPAHALARVDEVAKELGKDGLIVMNMCGRGDKDMRRRAIAELRPAGRGSAIQSRERQQAIVLPAVLALPMWPGNSLAPDCVKDPRGDWRAGRGRQVYLFNKQAINHYFCANCGISTHGGGVAPDGKQMVAVNLRCVPDIDLDALEIQKFDGANL
jgi:hypothetical protein